MSSLPEHGAHRGIHRRPKRATPLRASTRRVSVRYWVGKCGGGVRAEIRDPETDALLRSRIWTTCSLPEWQGGRPLWSHQAAQMWQAAMCKELGAVPEHKET